MAIDIQAFIDVGEAEGIIEEEERQLIHSVFEFGDKTVEEVMTPRTEIVAVANNARCAGLRSDDRNKALAAARLSRTDRQHRSLIYVRDLLICWTAIRLSLRLHH